jgi:hypothetical protein
MPTTGQPVPPDAEIIFRKFLLDFKELVVL